MPREISDEEYAWFQQQAQLAQNQGQTIQFIESIWNDPVLSKEAKALVKKKYPQVQIPDYDLEQQFNSRLDEERKAREKVEKEKKDFEEQEKFKSLRGKVQKDYGFTDDGMKELEDFMVKNNVGNYEVAAEYRAAKNPKQSEAEYNDGFWHHQKQDGFANIAADPEGWARGEILKSLRKDQERERGRGF